jgi:hypothetical protein
MTLGIRRQVLIDQSAALEQRDQRDPESVEPVA